MFKPLHKQIWNINYIGLFHKNDFRIDFGLWEVPKIYEDDDDDDGDDHDGHDDDNDEYDVFSLS